MTRAEEARDAVRQLLDGGEGTESQRIADAMTEASLYLEENIYSGFFRSYGADGKTIARRCLAILGRMAK